MRNTRGFTLVELMVVVVMMAIVGGATVRMLVNTQRLSREQAERVGLQSSLRTGAFLVPSELAEVGINAGPPRTCKSWGPTRSSIAPCAGPECRVS